MEQEAWAILKKKGVTNPSAKQIEDSKKIVAEEYHAIHFLYLADHQRYGKILEDMENSILRKKDPFPKNVSESYRTLTGWHNSYGRWSI